MISKIYFIFCIFRFEEVPLITPNSDVLISDMSFEVSLPVLFTDRMIGRFFLKCIRKIGRSIIILGNEKYEVKRLNSVQKTTDVKKIKLGNE